ncbi:rhomboid family intramembrane serine protease [Sphingorhabdus buctiana]|uniref:Rhomboid family intramembrane serine protease n=1 Tax=Sphingorhabdus buctiana TaxID=1508805 RepID=A0ABW4MC56_9SPHN
MQIAAGPVTKTIAAINIVVAVIMLIPGLYEPLTIAGALIPARFSMGDAVFGDVGYMLPAWLTPISSAFLHGGILHVALNMLMLLMVGANLERVLGSKGIAIIYAAGIFAAALTQFASDPQSAVPVVGASGAISALFASHMQLFPRNRPKAWGAVSGKLIHSLQLLAAWIAFNLMMGFVGPGIGVNIAIWAHIGGFIAGLLLTWPLLNWRYRNA